MSRKTPLLPKSKSAKPMTKRMRKCDYVFENLRDQIQAELKKLEQSDYEEVVEMLASHLEGEWDCIRDQRRQEEEAAERGEE